MSLDILPRDLIPIITETLSIRDILAINTTSKVIRVWLWPCISNANPKKTIIIRPGMHSGKLFACSMPQLNKHVILSGDIRYAYYDIRVRKVCESDDSCAFTLCLTEELGFMNTRYVYVLDGMAKYIVRLASCEERMVVLATRSCIDVIDMLTLIAKSICNDTYKWNEPAHINKEFKRKYSAWPAMSYIPMLESAEFLQFIVSQDH